MNTVPSRLSVRLPVHQSRISQLLVGLLGLLVFAVPEPTAHAATVVWRAQNAAVYVGLPFASLEFENPLPAAASVLGHPILQWLDADYSPGPPRTYDDWIVNPTNQVDGNANEVWLRASGHFAQTKFQVATDTVSVHLVGDSTDGLAEVSVDGTVVARLQMSSSPAETALVIVRDLPVRMHDVMVKNASAGSLADVAILGAAALKDDFKWIQPPVSTEPGNVFNGWNQRSVYGVPEMPLAADDWVCKDPLPVTGIRWWGSFSNWLGTEPPQLPPAFNLTIWTDVPAGTNEPFSHPGTVVHRVVCQNYTVKWVGWDFDPRTGTYESCFLFEYVLPEAEWFRQELNPTGAPNIYWLSVAAMSPDTLPQHPWGWKTRARDPESPAPDAAVEIWQPNAPTLGTVWQPGGGKPITFPSDNEWWDLAFELISAGGATAAKYQQPPDLTPEGMDVNATHNPEKPPPYLLADDFPCNNPGPITEIVLYGSWYSDLLPGGPDQVYITLSLHADIPAKQSPTGYSMPGAMLWTHGFQPGAYRVERVTQNVEEGWFTPPEFFRFPGDKTCWKYTFPIPREVAFYQKGTAAEPVVYWLDAQAVVPPTALEPAWFGWKTSRRHWNDDAVWVSAIEPYTGIWRELRYPPMHPLYPQSVDLAFEIHTEGDPAVVVKWSQPPVRHVAPDNFNGWNQPSIQGSQSIVADDWVCADPRPISDIHWWGSFIGWQVPTPPETVLAMPSAFVFTIWTDVQPVAGGPNWSHPGKVLWRHATTNYTMSFAGWDWDPRNPLMGPEACFKFHVDLLPEQWFHQESGQTTNIYWLSIAAVYPVGTAPQYPWGWKTRPRDAASLAPDDAVVIAAPTAPGIGDAFQQGYPIEYPDGVSWDMAFELTAGQEVKIDFGDAPDPKYPTLLASNGARHVLGPMFLGKLIDAEPDGQPNANATGDDINPAGADDEDGVQFHAALIGGVPNTVTVTTTTGGYLQAWLDANADGDWADPGEKVVADRLLAAGSNAVTFVVPGIPGTVTSTFMRFRLSGLLGLSETGQAPDGEVEDYQVRIEPLKWLQRPVLGWEGVDVDNSRVPLADDFKCSQTGPITDFHIWGSFRNDILPPLGPGSLTITLTLYSDVPAGPDNHSHPGQLLWQKTFKPGEYQTGHCWHQPDGEWWHNPPAQFWAHPADHNIYQYDFYINREQAFVQVEGTIYWLAMKYTTTGDENFTFGWKTTSEPWNDDACWLDSSGPLSAWRDMRYGDGHPWAEQANNSLNLAFAVSGEPGQAPLDWGDAPDPGYPTRAASNGARHSLRPGMFLGARIDTEPDGQPNATATGDDLNNLADEDGVTFNLPLYIGQAATVTVTASMPGILNAWLDMAGNGNWTDAGDQICNNVALIAGTTTLTFNIPSTAVPGNTCARFRYSSANVTATGPAPDGEVEDYQVRLSLLRSDLGDAPDSSNASGALMTAYPGVPALYPTVFNGPPPIGPIHHIADVAYLGLGVSGELEADIGPDMDGTNNILPGVNVPNLDRWDDGLKSAVLPHCGAGTLQVQYTIGPLAPVQLFINVWADWNRDGDWNDVLPCPDGNSASEWAVANFPVPPAAGTFVVPLGFRSWHPTAQQTPLWIRITLSEQQWPPAGGVASAGGEGPANGYQFGETEDYYLKEYETGETVDYGDAPDPTYPTVLASNGARHIIVQGFSLGKLEDPEANGQPNITATGDDLANQPDEDGVQLATPIVRGSNACVNVFLVSGPAGGKLDAWLDFNKDGAWGASEKIFNNLPLNPGANNGLCFAVPKNAKLGYTYARFRLSSVGSLSTIGLAQDGEVEDYRVAIKQRRPSLLVITNITVTNITSPIVGQVATIYWTAEPDITYQLQATPTLTTIPPTWIDVGDEVIGPTNWQRETNTMRLERYYQVKAPWTDP